jgi:hypothetical protein
VRPARGKKRSFFPAAIAAAAKHPQGAPGEGQKMNLLENPLLTR